MHWTFYVAGLSSVFVYTFGTPHQWIRFGVAITVLGFVAFLFETLREKGRLSDGVSPTTETE